MQGDIRIQNVRLKPHKHIYIALRAIYGIGQTRAGKICDAVSIARDTKVKEIDEPMLRALQEAVAKYTVEGELRQQVSMSLKRLRDNGCYRGKRHRNRLPVRGQRTRTNARTRKGVKGKKVAGK